MSSDKAKPTLAASLHTIYQKYKNFTAIAIDWLMTHGLEKAKSKGEGSKLPVGKFLKFAGAVATRGLKSYDIHIDIVEPQEDYAMQCKKPSLPNNTDFSNPSNRFRFLGDLIEHPVSKETVPLLYELENFLQKLYVPLRSELIVGLNLLIETCKTFAWKNYKPNLVNLRVKALRLTTEVQTSMKEFMNVEDPTMYGTHKRIFGCLLRLYNMIHHFGGRCPKIQLLEELCNVSWSEGGPIRFIEGAPCILSPKPRMDDGEAYTMRINSVDISLLVNHFIRAMKELKALGAT
ncbi:hypothetical protein K469DRAFT_689862 [Zopfia rhizophila CBS 207.26]|uniref:Uncharacterized protein n=1 Tax=Zopfia rhizophila CBS 207.26 TaxID=1314779 RepID=A0A6A6DZA5_9PEZI|nr:hypothetical protein K469DRAFT_689862 [Zopfia rhizophila CBS 207.26]